MNEEKMYRVGKYSSLLDEYLNDMNDIQFSIPKELQAEKERIELQKEVEKAKQENREYTPPARSYSTEFTKQFLPGPDPSIPDTEDMERLNGSLMLPEMEEIMPDINAPFSEFDLARIDERLRTLGIDPSLASIGESDNDDSTINGKDLESQEVDL
ncbi:Oidioi.mRNA.OKI2018_I69.chr1.g3479.t1.cds [Oikopleura dioica]|uniref:Oidioi.mRNA.OKI2018_I69.chr1.g3479.t1.cds n=1 Tax=Oikopleura dioica TaxID=34765 RepID=A0ABN7SY68_OIKDI|nr:Oidioi.mRNA.OKI2018_I69.chr1.g3479.t1.cds [Oikopleura dioica]